MSTTEATLTANALIPAAPSTTAAWEHLIDVFAAPARVARAIKERPTWLLPLLLLSALEFTQVFWFYNPSTEPAKLMLTYLLQLVPILFTAGVTSLAVGGLLLILGNPATTPGRVFALVVHVLFAAGALNFALTGIGVLLDVNGVTASEVPFTSFAPLVSASDNLPLNHVLASINILALVKLTLLTIGLSVLTSKRRADVGLALLGGWAGYLCITTLIKVAVA